MAEKETKQEIIGKHAKKVVRWGFRYAINYTLLIFEIVAIVLLTLMSVGFDGWEYLITATFIITTVILFAIYGATHWTLFNLRIKKLRANPDNIEKQKALEIEIKKTTDTKEWVEYSPHFLSWREVEKKREAWKIHIQNKITKLEKKASAKEYAIEETVITDFQRNHLSESELKALQESLDQARSKSPYSIKKRLLTQQLTDEWVAKNLYKISIAHDDVNGQFIETGSLIKGQVLTKTEERGKYFKDNAVGRLGALLITMFISAFTIDLIANIQDAGAWITFAFRMLFLLINIISGLDYADGYYRDVDVHNATARYGVTKEFWVWFERNVKKA